jgi:hypothetical protein
VNQAASNLALNGVSGTTSQPAVLQVPAGTPISAAFGADVPGRPWDTLLSLGAVIPRSAGAYQTPGGQLVNLSAIVPFYWLNSGGLSPLLLPFPGNFTTQAVPPSPGTVSVQQFIVTPAYSDGYAVSQACQLDATAPSSSCAINLPAGPAGDDSAVTVSLSGTGGCIVPMAFYGTSYTAFHVSSNGRVTFQAQDPSYSPTVTAARTGRPFAGFWTDLNPLAGGSITITRPAATRFRTAWNGVRYYGESATVTFAVELDTQTGAVILDNLLGINSNPESQSLNLGQNQFLGISRGAGATSGGTTFFAPGLFGGAANATDMLFDFYDAASQFGGLCPSLQTPLNRITFLPAANGNYSWTAQ